MERLSSPTESLKSHYEIAVIGSGYGGGIAASRLSRAGRQVAVFERGREIHSGEYPTMPPIS
jgi:cholesterol oxidase